MAKNDPVKCERCGTLNSVGNLCLTCREQTRKGGLKRVLLALVAIPVGCAVLVLVGLAGKRVYDWIYDHVEPVWRAHSCKGELQTALGRDRPSLDASVEKCQPLSKGGVLCFVRQLEDGQYKTRPVEWNCKPGNLPIR